MTATSAASSSHADPGRGIGGIGSGSGLQQGWDGNHLQWGNREPHRHENLREFCPQSFGHVGHSFGQPDCYGHG